MNSREVPEVKKKESEGLSGHEELWKVRPEKGISGYNGKKTRD